MDDVQAAVERLRHGRWSPLGTPKEDITTVLAALEDTQAALLQLVAAAVGMREFDEHDMTASNQCFDCGCFKGEQHDEACSWVALRAALALPAVQAVL